jgi:phage shock protein A
MFRRIANLFRGFLSLFIGSVERQNPEALLEVEKENIRRQIANYNQGLAAHAGLCERLMTQVKRLEQEERELRAKTAANLRAGNRDLASQQALRLQTVQRELVENRTQLESAEGTYKELLRARDVSVKAAQAKIESLKTSLNEMASGMISQIGGSGDTLNRLHEMLEEEREKAAGRARVARDTLHATDFEMQEHEQKALADQALADFAANEGLALEPPKAVKAIAAAEQKSLGPKEG